MSSSEMLNLMGYFLFGMFTGIFVAWCFLNANLNDVLRTNQEIIDLNRDLILKLELTYDQHSEMIAMIKNVFTRPQSNPPEKTSVKE